MNQISSDEWLSKADEDLLTAKILLSVAESPNRSIAFSSQQSIEKSLKAFLSSVPEFRIPKSHDLGLLVKFCKDKDLDFSGLNMEKLIGLSYFAVEARYPGNPDSVTRDEANESFHFAKRIREIVQNALKQAE
ncbi:MAG: hypothetical protein A2Y33_16585 [Spirochaetes bacterium GWF1_51_8]|nr:MAG: hypothetical protein A2Y33_16585 [Spirochaetes bacterium GWF1_51_8]